MTTQPVRGTFACQAAGRVVTPISKVPHGNFDSRIWNLVPMARDDNSRKGARLPRPAFIDALANLHHGMIVAVAPMESRRWRRFGEEYAGDLRIDPAGLFDRDQMVEAYRGTVGPMLAIAARMGFPQGWP